MEKFQFISKRGRDESVIKIKLAQEIESFLHAKRLQRRRPKTVSAYEQVLEQFRKWYESRAYTEITVDILRGYIEFLTFEKVRWDDHPTNPHGEAGLSARTVNNVIRNMRIFFNHLKRENIITYSPMDSVGYQTEEQDTFEVFTDDDVLKLLQAPNRRVYTGRRDYCMMLVLVDTGLRIKELTGLKVADVDLKLRQITIPAALAKTNRTRIVPISQLTAKELSALIDYMGLESSDYLWLTQFGERYLGDTFSKMLKLYAKRSGVTGCRVSPHTFRHYFAVKFLREKGDPIALQRILGHSSLNMVQVYVKYTGTDLSTQHDESSPVTALLDRGNEKKRGKTKFK